MARESPERMRLEGLLEGLRSRALRDLAARHGIDLAESHKRADVIAAILDSPKATEALREVASQGEGEAAAFLRDQLAATRDSIHEAANLGATVGPAEDALRSAADSLDLGEIGEAEDAVARAARLATEAKDRRIHEIEGSLSAVEDHIQLARAVGADVEEASRLSQEAQVALDARSYADASELAKRAERIAMEGQLHRIQQAILLREGQIEKAEAMIASCEPLIEEAESYDLSVAELRTLLRQARDVLARGDYVAGVTLARNAEEAGYRLEAKIADERRRRGIIKPAAGECGACGSPDLTFYDDGWGRCNGCGTGFRWRPPLGLRERLKELLGT